MLHLQHTVPFQTNSSPSPPTRLIYKQKTEQKLASYEIIKKRNKSYILCAVENDSEFEVDPDKAREALRRLDEQLESLSKKQVDPPRIRASDLSRAKDPQMREETLEISGSFLAYSAFALTVFTIFYNILFLTVIKPAIDGPEVDMASITEAREAEPSQQPLSMPEVVVEP